MEGEDTGWLFDGVGRRTKERSVFLIDEDSFMVEGEWETVVRGIIRAPYRPERVKGRRQWLGRVKARCPQDLSGRDFSRFYERVLGYLEKRFPEEARESEEGRYTI